MSTAAGCLARAEDFIWRNARLLERQLFRCRFRGGDRVLVLAALAAYQNADGGFGNALEPDKRCPDSQPVDLQVALEVLALIGRDDGMIGRMLTFLEGITTAEGGVPFVLPSVRAYPRAPWWETDDDPPASLNPTAAIAGLLHQHGARHRWLDRATDYCWRALAASATEEVHELLCILRFLEHAPDRTRAEAEFARVAERIRSAGLVTLDPAAAGYVKKPLDWAPRPEALARRLFDDEVIAAHLDALIAGQAEDGGWPITWGAVGPGAEMEYRGLVTLQALDTLRAYGRLS